MVSPGSTMTRSPSGSVRIKGLGWVDSYCSAMSGEMLHLKNPTPLPKRTRPNINAVKEPDRFAMTEGMAAMMIKM